MYRLGRPPSPGWSWREAATTRELVLKQGASREPVPHISFLCFLLIDLARPRGKPAPTGAFCRAQPSRTQSRREKDGEWVGVEVQKE